MKKTLLCLAAVFMAITSANAQVDSRLFNHLSVGLNVGTTGIGADVAMPATRFLDIQAGFSIMPKITYSTDIHTNLSKYNIDFTGIPQVLELDKIPVQGKLKMINGKVLINFYPIPLTGPMSSLHLTVGAYFGSSSIVEVYNKEEGQLKPINQANGLIRNANEVYPGLNQEEIGLKLGDYLLQPDANGNAKATLKTNSFKPYVGIGYGRAVPKGRIGFKVDLGVLFWGSPDVIDHNDVSLMKQDLDGKDGGAFRIISKFKVYPVLNFRICGKLF